MTVSILVVEDNPITRKMVRFALERQGYEVLDAPTGQAAIAMMAQNRPGLVLQDLLLPDVDGFELVARLRQLPNGRDVPILAFSGFLSKVDEARVSAAGFDDVITKPVAPSQLLRLVQAYLPAAPTVGPFGRGRTLLVVDDDPVQRKLACFRLTGAGFAVTAAADGVAALELARATVPDIIVSDVMMPRLDGFGLCAAVRQDSRLAEIPVVLMSNSYVDAADRDLAARVGATRFLVRSPDLHELLEVLREQPQAQPVSSPSPVAADVEHERANRVLGQLEKQVALNDRMAQRSAHLAAELSVLSGISDALSRHQDIDAALDEVLAACFDAGGISVGSLYLLADGETFRARRFGAYATWSGDELGTFFGNPELLLAIVRSGAVTVIPSPAVPAAASRELLERSGAASALVVPLVHQEERLGALLMVSKSAELAEDDRVAFARSVASQISQALVLARTFGEKATSEREALRQAAVLRSIIDSIGDGIAVADETGKIILWNRNAGAMARPDVSVLRPDQTTPVPPDELPLARAVRGDSVDGVEVFVRPADGRDSRWLSVSARPLRDEHGVARGGVSVFRDVTAEKAAKEQLTLSDRMVSVGTLAAGVAHELNNPLASVLANLDLAVRDVATLRKELGATATMSELDAELRDAREAAQRLRLIVRDLKIFSRADEDKRGPVDVERVLDSSLRMAWNEIRHRAELVKSYGQVPPVVANESRLGQVFLNLIINAAQAIEEGHAEANQIRVATRVSADGRVLVDVGDTGHGIAPEVQKRLFTPFFTTKPIGVGTGLGLSICHRIVTDIGGTITVDSEVGKGTVFHVALPAAARVEADEPAEAPAPARAARRGRVLVVDDEEKILAAVRRTLQADHDVTPLAKARDALARVTAGERFDVILCDIMMPEMTGIELSGEIAKLSAEQARRIVFLTGGAFTARAREFLDEAPNRRLEKPFDTEELRALVNDLVRGGG